MIAQALPRDVARSARLLRVDPRAWAVRDVDALAEQFRPGDLVVVNDAATLPASFQARTPSGQEIEIRLAGPMGQRTWAAVLFGSGDWRMRTEKRLAPPVLQAGARLSIGDGALTASVREVSDVSPRLITLEFDRGDEALWAALYRAGRPIQYSHLSRELALWDAQTAFGGRPWSVETPSAARPLGWRALSALRRRGIAIASVTHAAGLSSTGDPAIDAALPLPERSEVSQATVDASAQAQRVIAIGTSTARALEGNAQANGGVLVASCGVTSLRIGPGYVPRVVDGILTGMHEAGTSHFDLLTAFAPRTLLSLAWSHAEDEGYVGEEFGDAMLILEY